MKLIKTLKQSVLFKTFEELKKCYLSIAVFQFFDFESPHLLPEQDLWKFLAEELGKDAVIDQGMPKPNGEVLVMGKCYSPQARPIPAHQVSLSIGPVSKTLYVFGNRYWRRKGGVKVISDREPFTEMEISYQNAFGGPDYEKNPLGKGLPMKNQPRKAIPLPNIEHPDNLIGSPEDTPEPASFAPLDMNWPQRRQKAGTYDEKWLRERFPGFAEDMDPAVFNCAPEDQWIKGFFKGDEEFELINMHPEEPRLSGRLPGFRARTFINLKEGEKEELKEVKMRAETVWLFPAAKKGILVHRGTAEIKTDDADDVLHLMAAYESINEKPLSLDHYRTQFEKRTDEESGFLLVLQERGLAPESEVGVKTGSHQNLPGQETESLLTANMQRKAEKEKEKAEQKQKEIKEELTASLQGAGLDPVLFLPDPAPPKVPDMKVPDLDPNTLDPEEVMKFMKDQEENAKNMAEKMQKEALEKKAQTEKQLKEMCEKQGVDFDEVKAKIEAGKKKRPVMNADDILGRMRQLRQAILASLHQMFARIGIDPAVVMAQAKDMPDHPGAENLIATVERLNQMDPDNPELIEKLKQAEDASRMGYRMSAHHRDPYAWPTGEEAKKVKEIFLDLRKKDESLTNRDFAGIDLSGMDLKNLDLTECYLEGANLAGADLSGANLTRAVVAYANLEKAKLQGATLIQASLGAANLKGAEFNQADLTEAILGKADLAHASFDGANLTRADLMGATFNQTSMDRANLAGSPLLEIDFQGASFKEADISEAVFLKAGLKKCNFSGAKSRGTIFIEPDGEGAVFKGADLTNARFLQKARLTKADFGEAILDEANLIEADLTNASFVKARLDKANLMKAAATGADFTGAVAKRANLMKADLERARLVGMNLMEANLMKARLVEANLTRASLYGAEVMKIVVGKTRFDNANLKMTKIADWNPDDQE